MTHPDESEQLLDAAFRSWDIGLTTEERAALQAWQRLDRTYDEIQRALREGTNDPVLESLLGNIASSIAKGSMSSDMSLWRGVRSASRTFGVDSNELDSLVKITIRFHGFMATTLSRIVAMDEFAVPPLVGGAVLMEIHVRRAMPAAWVALVGDPQYKYQQELLLAADTSVRVTDVTYSGDIATLEAEVI